MALLVPAPLRPGGRGADVPSRPTGPRSHRALPVLLLGATAGLVGVLVLALLVGGGAPQASASGLPSAGPVAGWGLHLVTLVLRLAAVATVGALTLAALLVPRGADGGTVVVRRAVGVSAAAALVWLLAEGARVLLLTASLLAVPVHEVPSGAVLDVLTGLAPGRAALLSAGLLASLLPGVVLTRARLEPGSAGGGRRHAVVLLLLALAALLSPVLLAGHGAGADDHVLAVGALAVHVVTAAAWVGGLGAVVLLAGGLPRPGPVVRRFSTLALACVLLLGASGVVSAAVLTGVTSPADAAALLGTGYGAVLLAKTGALVVLVAAGAWHRRRTLAALEAGRPRAFRRLAVGELVVMVATVAVAVGLAASPPPTVASPGGPDPAAAAAPGPAPADTGTNTGTDTGAADTGAADTGAADTGAAETGAAGPARADAVDPMAGHDHGELSVAVLVDEDRFHVGGPVRPGQAVTVYNSGSEAVTLTAADGSFDADVPGRTFITFPAPARPGDYEFASRTDPALADVLVVGAG